MIRWVATAESGTGAWVFLLRCALGEWSAEYR